MTRVVCKSGKDLIFSFETMSKLGSDGMIHAYHDSSGYPTIGVGHLLSKVVNESLVKYPSMTVQAAHDLFDKDVIERAIQVDKLIKVAITDNQFGAILCLEFNIGIGNLTDSTLIKKLNAKDSKESIGEEFDKWDKSCGVVSNGLIRRRKAEKDLFLS